MLCLSCAARVAHPLCTGCRSELAPGPGFVLPGGLTVAAAFRHSGAARRLVHRLKYEGLGTVAGVLADGMAKRLPVEAKVLVPVPRATVRRIRYGVDPALALARALSRRSGLPVMAALTPAWWWPRHATRDREARRRPVFRNRLAVPSGVVLVDDVVTSGVTMGAAARVLGGDLRHGIAASSPGRVDPGGAQGVSSCMEAVWRSDCTNN